jgi:hypothetical protein
MESATTGRSQRNPGLGFKPTSGPIKHSTTEQYELLPHVFSMRCGTLVSTVGACVVVVGGVVVGGVVVVVVVGVVVLQQQHQQPQQ